MGQSPCPVCMLSAEQNSHPTRDAYIITCQRCGIFAISRTLIVNLKNEHYTRRKRMNASSLLFQINDKDFMLTTDNYRQFFESRDITILEKADKLLSWIASELSNDDEFNVDIRVDIMSPSLQSICWAIDPRELNGLYQILVERSFLVKVKDNTCRITANGWERLEVLRSPNRENPQGFVAMWFAPHLLPLYVEVIGPAIAEAGYTPHRVDQREYAGKIDDEIIRQIRASRFIVADATGDNSGAYYEAGFAHGLGLPVFWTCKKAPEQKLHFDVRQHNCIFWEEDKLDEFRVTLTRRIEAELGKGPIDNS